MKGTGAGAAPDKGWGHIDVRFWLVLALLPLLIVSAPTAMAQETGAQCTAIADNAERLACFDAAFAAPVAASAASVVFESQQLIPARPNGRRPGRRH